METKFDIGNIVYTINDSKILIKGEIIGVKTCRIKEPFTDEVVSSIIYILDTFNGKRFQRGEEKCFTDSKDASAYFYQLYNKRNNL
jgi:hypothetical protein